MRTHWMLALCVVLGSCSRSEPQASAPAPVVPTKAPTPAASFALPAAKRVVAIGDLHGDLVATRHALQLARAIDAEDRWIGGDLVVVQTGDFLDRGDDERAIFELTDALRVAAPKSGGALVALSGNHELMNVAQDFRYVTPNAFSAFADQGGRDVAFRPGGSFARRLAERPIVVQVGDTVFVHGGVLQKHVRYGIARMNQEVRAWMLGQSAPPAIVLSEDGPIWTRLYSDRESPDVCAELHATLQALGAKRMVVGHTPQLQGITSACEQQVWRIDTGMAHHYGGPVEVLEIVGTDVHALKEVP